MDVAYENGIFRACDILFGKDVNICRDFLLYIQDSGVKSIYRQKALTCHPDRTIHLPDKERQRLSNYFIELTWAYKKLIDFISKRDAHNPDLHAWLRQPVHKSPFNEPLKPFEATTKYMRYYSGTMPSRPLLFGEYLYYSRQITWKAFIEAIVWQRKQRPKFGQIAVSWGYLYEDDIKYLLEQKQVCEKIGETAIRLKLLTPSEVDTVLLHQRLKQPKFGQYFIQNGLLTKSRLNEALIKHKIHNSSYNIRKVS